MQGLTSRFPQMLVRGGMPSKGGACGNTVSRRVWVVCLLQKKCLGELIGAKEGEVEIVAGLDARMRMGAQGAATQKVQMRELRVRGSSAAAALYSLIGAALNGEEVFMEKVKELREKEKAQEAAH